MRRPVWIGAQHNAMLEFYQHPGRTILQGRTMPAIHNCIFLGFWIIDNTLQLNIQFVRLHIRHTRSVYML
jgi:hypothetical protein